MLKLKSVVKTKEQLLATGWMENPVGNYINKEIGSFAVYVTPDMLGCTLNGVIKGRTDECELEEIDDIWILYPEMMLVVDQWGFVRDPETLNILMWDAVLGDYNIIKEIDVTVSNPILGVPIGWAEYNRYTKSGLYYTRHTSATLSKYPYSLAHGGYTPFDFKELKDAFNCPKVVEGNDDSYNDDSSTTNNDTPDVETVTTYEQDGYQYYLTRRKI